MCGTCCVYTCIQCDLNFVLSSDLTEALTYKEHVKGIPPHLTDHQLSGEWVVPQENGMNGPFSVFLVHLHYHSLGTLLTLEYLDASQEKDWKTIAKRVVSASQDMALDPPLVLKGGDRLKATCHYNSVNRTTATLFGFDAFTEEMCNVFLNCFGKLSTPVYRYWGNAG